MTPRTPARSRRFKTTVAAATVLCLGALCQAASAGTYTVTGTCGAWTQIQPPSGIAISERCPTLQGQNVVGNRMTPKGAKGGWVFTAPPGTTLERGTFDGSFFGGESWATKLYTTQPGSGGIGYSFVNCVTANCRAYLEKKILSFPGQAQLIATVGCEGSGSCPNSGKDPRGGFAIGKSEIVLNDPSAPVATIVGGSISTGGWNGGNRTINLSGNDNTGIQSVDAAIDGDLKYGGEKALPCDYAKPVPCANQTSVEVPVDLRGLPDGQHTLTVLARDAASNPGFSGPQVINVDNTAPLAPQQASLVGPQGFRSRNTFSITWTNPPESFAPIAGANYRVCPAGEPDSSPRCVTGTRDGSNLTRIDGITVPDVGAWKVRVWLYDAAGNATQTNGTTIGGLGLLAGRRSADGSKRRNTRLTAGRASGRKLKRRPTVKIGQGVTLRGRLTAGKGRKRRGLDGKQLLVYRRVQIQGARYQRVGTVRTGKRGRYRYRVQSGPSRRLQIVFPGGGRVQGERARVTVRVRARLKMRTDRRLVPNGDAVALSGRLRGGKIPPSGALLELQVYSRREWRPFATPRTDRTGRYVHRYRFETVQGSARFRFRAVLRRQATYPFSGRSRPVTVRVQGS